MFEAWPNTKDRCSSILRVSELTNQLSKTRETCFTIKKKQWAEANRLNDLGFQQILLKQKTADTLAHALNALVPLATSFITALEEVRKVLMKCDSCCVK